MSVADTVNEWFREKLAGGPLARDTDAYNQVSGALPDLVARLDPPAKPAAAAAAKPAPTPAAPPASPSPPAP